MSRKRLARLFVRFYKKVEPVKVDLLVHNGDCFDWCGGCEIVATYGHTPGHISLYLTDEKTIITGDAAALEKNELVIANPHFTLDMDNAKKSLSKLLTYDAKMIICYHGGIVKKG